MDDGQVAGYGYTAGVKGWARGGFDKGRGELCIAILDPSGAFRLEEKRPRTDSLIIHGGPIPTVYQTLLHPAQNRFAVQLDDGHGTHWQAYEISTGKRDPRFKDFEVQGAEAARAGYLMKAQAVAGTPLTLAHWRYTDEKKEWNSGLFTLIDMEGRQVWQLARPADYAVPGDEEAEQRLEWQLMNDGAILDTAQPGMFDLWFVRDKQRVIHTVERDAEGWRVKEIGRRPYTPPEKKGASLTAPVKPLAVLGTFSLADAPPANVLGDIWEWSFDGQGHIGILRPSGKSHEFALFDQDGKLLSSVALENVTDCTMHLAWVKDARWILTTCEPSGRAPARAWWIDSAGKTKTPIEGFSCPDVQSLAGTGDGGFVALARERRKFTAIDLLIAFDDKGQRRWSKTKDLFSPEAVTVTTGSEVAVLDVIRHTVQLFDLKGGHVRTIDLEKAWGREPSYPSEIMADTEGGLVIQDTGGNAVESFVWMKPDGSVRESFRPKYSDGRPSNSNGGVRVAPDGSAWACDGRSIFRLDAKRMAEQTIGATPDPEALQEIASVEVDDSGRIYAADQRSGTVHVYDRDGKKLRVLKPTKEDLKDTPYPSLTVSPEGEVYVAGLLRESYVHFAPDGKRLGLVPRLKIDKYSEDWYPRGNGRGMIVTAAEYAYLLNDAGNVTRQIGRRADHQWLGNPGPAAVAADGSFALASAQNHEGGTIDFFTAEGDPVATMPQPNDAASLIGFNGRHAVLLTQGEIWLVDRKGAPVLRFTLEDMSRWKWRPFLTAGGRELWALDEVTRKVTRFAMPGE